MPEQNLSPSTRERKQPPPSHTYTGVGKEEPLPALTIPKDGRFLGLPDNLAGRQVCIILYARGDSRDARMKAWKDHQGEVSLTALGIAAKTLENAGMDWRQARNWERVLKEAAPLTAH